MRTFVALNCIFMQTAQMSLGLGQDYYQNRQKTITIMIHVCMCECVWGKITVLKSRHMAFITDFDYSFVLFCCFAINEAIYFHAIYFPINAKFSHRKTLEYVRKIPYYHYHYDGKEAPLLDALAQIHAHKHTDTLSRLHLHFVIVFLFHQFVMLLSINTLKIPNNTCMRNIEQSFCNIHFTSIASIRYNV